MKRIFLISLLLTCGLSVSCGNRMNTVVCRQVFTAPTKSLPTDKVDKENGYLISARTFYEKDRYDSSLVYLHKTYAVDPSNWETQYYYALISLRLQKPQDARLFGNNALVLSGTDKPTRALLYATLGLAEELLNRYGEAKAHYHLSLQLDENCQTALDGLKRLQPYSLAE